MKTPQTETPALARALGLTAQVYLKREDLHPYGSHKGRSIPLMIKVYAKEGVRDFVISSSGNAALAAILAVEQRNKNNPGAEVRLRVFVGKNVNQKKLNNLQSKICDLKSVSIEQVERPKHEAFRLDAAGAGKYIRQSTDDLALEGYTELAQELNKIENLQAIFIPTSSGTTAQALGEAFQQLDQKPQIHIVQTVACHPIAVALTDFANAQSAVPSLATAIVDRVAHRKDKVVALIRQSHGAGWIVTDNEIIDAITLTKQTTDLDISPNSALSIAGLKKAVASGFTFSGPVVCLITGA